MKIVCRSFCLVVLLSTVVSLHSNFAYSQGSKTGIMVQVGANWGLGRAKNESESVLGRTLNTVGAYTITGYRLGAIQLGVLGEYRYIGQNTEAASVGDSNLKGSGYLLGGALSVILSEMAFNFGVSILGKYSLDLQNESGQDVSFGKPFGLHLFYNYFVAEKFSLDFVGSWVKYKQSEEGGTTSDISADQLSHWSVGVGMTFHINRSAGFSI